MIRKISVVSKYLPLVQCVAAFLISISNGFFSGSRISRKTECTSRIHLRAENNQKLFSNPIYETIQNGKIAVVPDFLPRHEIETLKRDASHLHSSNYFTTDALASYGGSGNFDPSKDRAVLKLSNWKSSDLGDWDARKRFAGRIQALRADLSQNLNRPNLMKGDSVTKYGQGSTEISYTRFGPGAFLKRHVDEHHEELKGNAGWTKPTRRSLSWLVYLNDKDWNADKDGGCLRCFERSHRLAPSNYVGAAGDGDLQVGWLRSTALDPFERPVFMDSQRPSKSGNCAMYIYSGANDAGDRGIRYITPDFYSHPTLYMAGGEVLTQKLLIQSRDLASRFQFIEPPKSPVTDLLNSYFKSQREAEDEAATCVEPTGGTLVVFDATSLPHEVLASIGRDRWATSGWLHEDQKSLENHPYAQS